VTAFVPPRFGASAPERRAQLMLLAEEIAGLTLRGLAGESVEGEIAHLKAQALSITTIEAGELRAAVLDKIEESAGSVISLALGALGRL
jgi:hypothetical protein